MFASLVEDIRHAFRTGSMVTRLIMINVIVFVLVGLFGAILWLSNAGVSHALYAKTIRFLAISSDGWFDLTHPWVIITHMFLHEGVWHLLWNMVFLYWFGRIVGDLIGNQRVLPIYILGGLGAAFFFILFANLFHRGAGMAMGASGAAMAMAVAAATIAPDYRLHLILFGEVRIKYIVAILILLDIILIGKNSNTGGHFGHLGGALIGFLYIHSLRSGVDPGKWIHTTVGRVARLFHKQRGRAPMVVIRAPEKTRPEPSFQDAKKLDVILEKIKVRGIDALTPQEKAFLDQQSQV